ncbi:hypothetical protein [Vulgatibacter incomptus]|uniref:Cytochrome c domain-containing protein n=1 Tax=Vulgatibacter incomptus TaxID=1391653 RepID=A0A0K1PA70_9BACT|nr:hypothetical protein [Vulgatibacter incomptus]AKU90433.1 hypothetical protein AKJ08_0820 [Vulgatibacter incomptus]
MKARLTIVCALLVIASGSSAAPGSSSGVVIPPRLDPHRSLAVTDQSILAPFTLERVLSQLVSQSGVLGLTAHGLYAQWWDIENEAPGFGTGVHCDDQTTRSGVSGLNGFPWECPREEGRQADLGPSLGRGLPYKPVGLFNRFDLAPADGSNCGEYRIEFARDNSTPSARRNLVIFEAVLPNPNPRLGLEGCRPVADFWANLSTIASDATVSAKLDSFYFSGLPGFEPVVHVDHYGMQLGADGKGVATGQIRSNQFMQDEWTLRQFALTKDCRCGPCRLVMVPAPVADNPYGELFRSASTEPLAPDLRAAFISSVASLAKNDANRFAWTPPNRVNAAESQNAANDASIPFRTSDYLERFSRNGPNDTFRRAINDELIRLRSSLTAEDIVARALSLSCAGCHGLAPTDLGDGVEIPFPKFTHVDEENPTNGRFPLSDALEEVFLPHRVKVLQDFLAGTLVLGAPAMSTHAIALPPSSSSSARKTPG